MAPTAPDTLPCHPIIGQDPFLMNVLPHIYFVGSCKKFETRMVHEDSTNKFCRLICVPKFSLTKSFVIVNLQTLDTFEINCENKVQ